MKNMESMDGLAGLRSAVREVGYDLKAMTAARISLGRFGSGQPTKVQLQFLLDHARAKEAVWAAADLNRLAKELHAFGLQTIAVDTLASDRSIYVRRPDLGRRLSEQSVEILHQAKAEGGVNDLVVVVADGLSATAIDLNAIPLVEALVARFTQIGISLAPIVLASQARVAVSDEIGEALGAEIAVILIGERPGLSSVDSLGAYLTYRPTVGTPDSRRNCVSNVRTGGMAITAAADAIVALVMDMRQTRVSGVFLKDAVATSRLAAPVMQSDDNALGNDAAQPEKLHDDSNAQD